MSKNTYKKWYAKNRAQRLIYLKAWRKANPEKARAGWRRWRDKDPQEYRLMRRAYDKAQRQKIKLEVFTHYSKGKPQCKCCGITELCFLTIDHINGDGAKQRAMSRHKTGTQFYAWLKRNKYPRGYQVYCFNCNHAKGIHAKCPHQN